MGAGEQAMANKRRKISNPLALAVLGTLRERPMHPYEMAATMRSHGNERSIKLNYGSLYTVVNNLAKHGLIEAMEASRAGRRPERTVYRLTDTGRAELEDWLADLLSTPTKEYPQFEAALSLLAVLGPGRVLELLRDRVAALEKMLSDERAELAAYPWLPRLFLLETEYHLAMQEAELAWVRGIVGEFGDGSFPDLAEWARWHETGELSPELSAMAAAALDQTGFPASEITPADGGREKPAGGRQETGDGQEQEPPN